MHAWENILEAKKPNSVILNLTVIFLTKKID